MNVVNRVLPFTPRPHQRAAFQNLRKFNVWNWARRQGKTEAVVQIFIRKAISCPPNRPNNQFVYVAPDRVQAKRIVWTMLKKAVRTIPCTINNTELTVTFPNGAGIAIWGAYDPSSFRGIGVGGLAIDEAQDVDKSLWEEHLPPVLATPIELLRKGEGIDWFVIFLFTPRGETFAYDMWKEGLTEIAKAKGLDQTWLNNHTTGDFNNDDYDKIIRAEPTGVPDDCDWFVDRQTVDETGYSQFDEFRQLSARQPPEKVLQEWYVHFILESEGILFRKSWIEANRKIVKDASEFWALVASMDRVVIGVDPKGSAANNLTYTGIIPTGIKDGIHYIFDDISNSGYPEDWANAIVDAFYAYAAASVNKMHNVEGVAVETNFGGDMCKHTLNTKDPNIIVYPKTASRGKIIRAEPMSTLTQMNRVKFVLWENGNDVEDKLAELIDQLINYRKGKPSPDRMDACVWAITHLIGNNFDTYVPKDVTPPTPPLPFVDAPPEIGMTQQEIWDKLFSNP